MPSGDRSNPSITCVPEVTGVSEVSTVRERGIGVAYTFERNSSRLYTSSVPARSRLMVCAPRPVVTRSAESAGRTRRA